MEQDADLIDLYEDMLSERAAKGIRPVLYISSCIDLECSMLVLLGGAADPHFGMPLTKPLKSLGHHFMKN